MEHLAELKLNENLSSFWQRFNFNILLVSIFLILLFKWFFTTTKKSPPSPPKLPVIGNLHQLGLDLHRSLHSLAQKHDPYMLLHFGSVPVLVVSSAEGAREILKTRDGIFTDRPKYLNFKRLFYNYKDILTAAYGEYWRQVKSICVVNLLSSQRVRSFRSVREEETKAMINKIQQACSVSASPSSSAVVNLSETFLTLTNDVVSRVALGRKYSDRGEEGRLFRKLSAEVSQIMSTFNIGDYIPWLAWFSHVNGLNGKLDDISKRFDAFLELVIQEHRDSSKRIENGHDHVDIHKDDHKDFVDILLQLQKDNAHVPGYPIGADSMKALILVNFNPYTINIWRPIHFSYHN